MDRRTLIAISLGILFFIGWQKYYIEPKYGHNSLTTQTQVAAPVDSTTTTSTSPSTPSAGGAVKTPVTQVPVEPRVIPFALAEATAMISNGGKFFADWNVEGYKSSSEKGAANVNLKAVLNEPHGMGEIAFDLPEYAYLNNVAGNLVQTGDTVTWTYEDQNVKLMREFKRTSGQKQIQMRLSGEFKAKKPSFLFVSTGSQALEKDPEKQDRQLLYRDSKELHRLHTGSLDPVTNYAGPIQWMGSQSRYFLLTLVPDLKAPRGLSQQLNETNAKFSMVYPLEGTRFEIPMKAYFGPKEMASLKSVDPTLTETIDLGFFTFFALGILNFLKWIHSFIPNWGLSIILLTIVIKLVTFPLTYKSMKSMKRMAVLQPQMNALREKYKDNKEALNRELMTFMKTQGYNPVSGCLPILIQMPVFFALWRVLYSSIELYQAPFFGWIQDLSLKDPYYVTPIALTVFMFLQQKLTPSTASDPMQAKMMQWMPVIFGFMMLNLPAGLTVYMLTNAIASIVQQIFLNRKFASAKAAPIVLPAQ